jgi:hypothetical protein
MAVSVMSVRARFCAIPTKENRPHPLDPVMFRS